MPLAYVGAVRRGDLARRRGRFALACVLGVWTAGLLVIGAAAWGVQVHLVGAALLWERAACIGEL